MWILNEYLHLGMNCYNGPHVLAGVTPAAAEGRFTCYINKSHLTMKMFLSLKTDAR